MKYFFVFGLIFITSLSAQSAYLEANGFLYSDNFTTSTANTTSSRFFDVGLGLSMDSKGYYLVGWNVTIESVSATQSASTTSYASTQMGPKLTAYLDKDRNWSLGFSYNLVTSATYSSG